MAMGPDGAVANLQLTLVPAEVGRLADVDRDAQRIHGRARAGSRSSGVPPASTSCAAVRMPRVAMAGGEVTTIQSGRHDDGDTHFDRDRHAAAADRTDALGRDDGGGWQERHQRFVARPAPRRQDDRHGAVQRHRRTSGGRIAWSSIGITLEPADQRPGISPGARPHRSQRQLRDGRRAARTLLRAREGGPIRAGRSSRRW